MTDRELLEAAAKAAGLPNTGEVYPLGLKLLEGPHNYWNPLTDDGDVFRLAMKLGISFSFRRNQNGYFVVAEAPGPYLFEAEDITSGNDEKMRAAGRLVIVRAAAAMGTP